MDSEDFVPEIRASTSPSAEHRKASDLTGQRSVIALLGSQRILSLLLQKPESESSVAIREAVYVLEEWIEGFLQACEDSYFGVEESLLKCFWQLLCDLVCCCAMYGDSIQDKSFPTTIEKVKFEDLCKKIISTMKVMQSEEWDLRNILKAFMNWSWSIQKQYLLLKNIFISQIMDNVCICLEAQFCRHFQPKASLDSIGAECLQEILSMLSPIETFELQFVSRNFKKILEKMFWSTMVIYKETQLGDYWVIKVPNLYKGGIIELDSLSAARNLPNLRHVKTLKIYFLEKSLSQCQWQDFFQLSECISLVHSMDLHFNLFGSEESQKSLRKAFVILKQTLAHVRDLSLKINVYSPSLEAQEFVEILPLLERELRSLKVTLCPGKIGRMLERSALLRRRKNVEKVLENLFRNLRVSIASAELLTVDNSANDWPITVLMDNLFFSAKLKKINLKCMRILFEDVTSFISRSETAMFESLILETCAFEDEIHAKSTFTVTSKDRKLLLMKDMICKLRAHGKDKKIKIY